MSEREWPELICDEQSAGHAAEIEFDGRKQVAANMKTQGRFPRQDEFRVLATAIWQRMILTYNATRHLSDKQLAGGLVSAKEFSDCLTVAQNLGMKETALHERFNTALDVARKAVKR